MLLAQYAQADMLSSDGWPLVVRPNMFGLVWLTFPLDAAIALSCHHHVLLQSLVSHLVLCWLDGQAKAAQTLQ